LGFKKCWMKIKYKGIKLQNSKSKG